MNFSKKMGITPSKEIQLDNMDVELKNCLWNAIKIGFIDLTIARRNLREPSVFEEFFVKLWIHFFKSPIDTIPKPSEQMVIFLRNWFFKMEWFKVYDFLEYLVQYEFRNTNFSKDAFINHCNRFLEIENSGYRIINGFITPITNKIEIRAIEYSINQTGQFTALLGANAHFENALIKLSDKKHPDYRNSIKEAISAVENVAKVISMQPKGTLNDALYKINAKTKIHSQLQKGFKAIYNYTSDSDGIRHSLMEESSCNLEDAEFMLVSCSAFVNYLVVKANKNGIDLKPKEI